MSNILEIKNLTKLYKNNCGIKDLSITFEKGKIYGVLGHNGAGKSTALKCISGLIPDYQGEISIDGVLTKDNARSINRKIGCIFESMIFYGDYTLKENLNFISNFYPDINKSRIDEVINFVGLTNYKKEKVRNFSLGMKQKLSIASAIYHLPDLYLLDEPTNGLDINSKIEFYNLIKSLVKNKQSTFLICSHISSEIEEVCDYIYILKNGKLISEGSKNMILSKYPSVAKYYIDVTGLEDEIGGITND